MPGQVLVQNYNTQQIFLGNNWDVDKQYTNATGGTVTILAGTVLGTIAASNKWLQFDSTATDGSENPRAINRETMVIAAGATVLMNAVNQGQVNQNAIIFFNGTDTINTSVGAAATGGTVQDLLQSAGITLVPSIELTIQDPNQ